MTQRSRPAFPGFAHLYSMQWSGGNHAYRADIDVPSREECRALLRGEIKRDVPIIGQWAMGGAKPRDVVWTTWATPMLISERVVQILRDHQFTGWDVFPIQLLDKAGEPLPTYYFLQVHGRSGPRDPSKSEPFEEEMPGRWVPRLRGLYFDPDTWDGSDIFLPEKTAFIVVTEPVKRALARAKVKNVLLKRLDTIVFNPER